MKTVIGLAMATTIGGLVVANLMEVMATVQATLNNVLGL